MWQTCTQEINSRTSCRARSRKTHPGIETPYPSPSFFFLSSYKVTCTSNIFKHSSKTLPPPKNKHGTQKLWCNLSMFSPFSNRGCYFFSGFQHVCFGSHHHLNPRYRAVHPVGTTVVTKDLTTQTTMMTSPGPSIERFATGKTLRALPGKGVLVGVGRATEPVHM